MTDTTNIGIDPAADRATAREPWLGVELRHLSALSAVARTGSFRQAAGELGYVQSAISQQVAHLEHVLGVRLIERQRGVKGVAPTEAGELIIEHAEEILAHLRLARGDLETLQEDGSRVLHVGVRRGLATGLLPPALRRLALDAPDVRVEATEGTDDADVLAHLTGGGIDAAFIQLPVISPELETEVVVVDEHVLLVSAASSLAASSHAPTLAELAHLPLVIHSAFPDVEAHLRAHGIVPKVAFRSDASATVEAVVAAGVGIALVPGLALAREAAGTVRIDAGHLLPPRTIGLCWRRSARRSRALDALRNATASSTPIVASHAA